MAVCRWLDQLGPAGEQLKHVGEDLVCRLVFDSLNVDHLRVLR
jgi:hypothetical protein